MIKPKFVCNEIYHVCNKSIANYAIYRSKIDSHRFIEVLDYYNRYPVWTSYSTNLKRRLGYKYGDILHVLPNALIKVLSYCIMPDHYHLLFKVVADFPIAKYINDIENSYSRYFNIKHKRKGPLWQSSYRCVRIKSNEQLLHTSRYIHLNPTSSGLVRKPEEWILSSYNRIITQLSIFKSLSEFSIQTMQDYRHFVESNIDYQQSLKKIKKLLLE